METGQFRTVIRVKSTATPIDNITKFAWADDDYEEIEEWHEYTEEEREQLFGNDESVQDEVDAMIVDHEYRLTILEMGL